VEQPLQPADQLGLRDPQLALARDLLARERQAQPLQLLHQLLGEAVLELLYGRLVDLGQPRPALLVERRRAYLFEQLPDHVPDPHHLRGLLDHLRGGLGLGLAVLLAALHRHASGPDDHHPRRALALVSALFRHAFTSAAVCW
jgi:hypothetical protein